MSRFDRALYKTAFYAAVLASIASAFGWQAPTDVVQSATFVGLAAAVLALSRQLEAGSKKR